MAAGAFKAVAAWDDATETPEEFPICAVTRVIEKPA